ncbi:Putative ribonuclease H protein At1g65750 [Linum grandiflorum]
MWQYSDSGAYTVQSGYSLLHSVNNPPVSQIDPELWMQVWSLPIPPKFSFFLWRIFHRILPTKEGLISKHIDVDPTCPVCLQSEETLKHLFLSCPLATKLSQLADLPYQMVMHTKIDNTWRKAWATNSVMATKLLLLRWRIWKSRNTVVFASSQTHPLKLLQQYKLHLADLAIIQHNPRMPHTLAPISHPNLTVWEPPSPGRVKINVDGATKTPIGGDICFVIRDNTGNIVTSAGRSFQGIFDSFSIEALAIQEALIWCSMSQFSRVDIESDALNVIQRITKARSLHKIAGVVIQEARTILSHSPNIKLLHVGRKCNNLAHSLAQHSLRFLPATTPPHNLTLLAIALKHPLPPFPSSSPLLFSCFRMVHDLIAPYWS